MKKILFTTVLFLSASSLCFAGNYEYPTLYKSTRTMGMGGANVAVGGHVDAFYTNPAGLCRMESGDWEFNLLNMGVSLGANVQQFTEDLQDAFDIVDEDEQMTAVNETLGEYFGENMHFGFTDTFDIGRGGENASFALSSIANLSSDILPHQGFGAEGLMEVNTSLIYGVGLGLGYKVQENVFLGASLKLLNQESVKHNFSVAELVENQESMDTYITDDLQQTASAVASDIGLIYEFDSGMDSLRPSLGISIMNIGGLEDLPMTVNLGAAIQVDLGMLMGGDSDTLETDMETLEKSNMSDDETSEDDYKPSLSLGFDYVDILGNFDQDQDVAKRLRFGGELVVFDSILSTLALRAGIYQGYPTYGLGFRLLLFDVSYVKYTEEIGAYAGQVEDERQMINFTLGW